MTLLPLITVEPKPLNQRLWELVRKKDRTAAENLELDCLCKWLETETGQDNIYGR